MIHGEAPVAEPAIPVGLTDLVTLMLAAKGYVQLQQPHRRALDASQQRFLVSALLAVERYCGVLGFDVREFLGEADGCARRS